MLGALLVLLCRRLAHKHTHTFYPRKYTASLASKSTNRECRVCLCVRLRYDALYIIFMYMFEYVGIVVCHNLARLAFETISLLGSMPEPSVLRRVLCSVLTIASCIR